MLGGLVSMALLASGCARKAADAAPVPWSNFERAIDSQVGSYTKTTTFELNGERRVALIEWVSYDLRRPFIDRRLGIGDNLLTPEIEEPPTQSAPSLRFLYGSDRVVMWNPVAVAKCNTPWVAMPQRILARITGLRFDDLLKVEPKAMLENSNGNPTLVANDDSATTYEVIVPATTALPASALMSQPALAAKLEGKTLKARVRISRHDAPLEISAALAPALESVPNSGPADRSLVVTWRISRTTPAADPSFPRDAAPASCLDQ